MIAKRLAECGLELNEHKTRIVYCKDDDRRGSYEHTSFDFLSYTFRPRRSKSRFGKYFLNFSPAVSREAKTRMRREMRSWSVARRSDKTLTDLALMFNRQLQGWINYFGRFYKSMLYPVFRHFNEHAREVGHAEIQTTASPSRAERAGSSLTSQDASPACSRTGGWACALTAGRWEPGELRGSRRVLRAPEGETPSGDSPPARVHRTKGRSRGDQTSPRSVPARGSQAGAVRDQDADHPRPHRRGTVPRLRDHRPATTTEDSPLAAESANGRIRLHVPADVIKAKCARYTRGGKPERRPGLMNEQDYAIISRYGAEYRGIVQYYLLAGDVWRLNRLHWVMLTSLLKTLAGKHDSSVSKMARKYAATIETPHGPRKCMQVSVDRGEGRKPLVATFGGIPLRRQKNAVLIDRQPVRDPPAAAS